MYLASLVGALALALLLVQGSGCGSDPVCPLGASGSNCELMGELGSAPDVPVGADTAGDASTLEDANDSVEDPEVLGSDTQTADTNDASETEGDDAASDDAAGAPEGEGADQTPNADASDSGGSSTPGDGAGASGARGTAPGAHQPPRLSRRRA